MKRRIFLAAGFITMTIAITSCEDLLGNCKVCQQNTYNSSGTLLTEGQETQYCDAALLAIEATKPETVLGITTKWVCR
jgi:hypothetical protein